MKRVLLTILFFVFQTNFGQPVTVNAVKINEQLFEADSFIGEDAYGYLYFIKKNVFVKVKQNEIWQYKNVSLGKISKIDFHNPLKIVLFYENFNTIIAVDNQLNEVEKINFSEVAPDLVASAVGIAANNNLWVFNNLTQQLGFYSYLKNNYQKMGLPINKSIKTYYSDFNHFYWINIDNQFYSCDIFGKTTLIGIIPEFETIFIQDEKLILYQKDSLLYLMDLNKKTTYNIKNIEKSFTDYHYKNQILTIFTNEGITNYKINLP